MAGRFQALEVCWPSDIARLLAVFGASGFGVALEVCWPLELHGSCIGSCSDIYGHLRAFLIVALESHNCRIAA